MADKAYVRVSEGSPPIIGEQVIHTNTSREDLGGDDMIGDTATISKPAQTIMGEKISKLREKLSQMPTNWSA